MLIDRFRRDPSLWGILLGVVYGVTARLTFNNPAYGSIFATMTLAFLVVVPPVIGYLTVAVKENPSRRSAIITPWISCLVIVVITMFVGLEGAICVAMGLPLMMILSSIGGLVARSSGRYKQRAAPVLLILPYIVAPIENQRPNRPEIITTATQIVINAPVSTIWPLVVSVDSIKPSEMRRALFTTIGFPRPVSAVLSHEGLGGVRRAKFTGGLVFTETVTDWRPGVQLSFTIRPNTNEIPPGTLDPHVTIGGPYFDVLTGTYTLEAMGPNTTLLRLFSRHRVSTPFNGYSGLWADQIMKSIQTNILEVIRARAEAPRTWLT